MALILCDLARKSNVLFEPKKKRFRNIEYNPKRKNTDGFCRSKKQ